MGTKMDREAYEKFIKEEIVELEEVLEIGNHNDVIRNSFPL